MSLSFEKELKIARKLTSPEGVFLPSLAEGWALGGDVKLSLDVGK